jgi:hypothetical protein
MRIQKLPRRNWEIGDKTSTSRALTSFLKTPQGQLQLRDVQAVALKECYENRGLFGPIPVGFGKSLISFLSPVLCDVKRPLLLIPAKLKAKTERDLAEYSKHFKMPEGLKIMSYELLSRERGQKELLEFKPDMIISDECHRLKNIKAACTKRVGRWIKEHPETIFCGMSGTITRKSIMDYDHMLRWALKEYAPIPAGWRETKEWSLALDEDLAFEWERYAPGALLELLGDTFKKNIQLQSLELARKVYSQRLTETPGVVSVQGERLGTSLLLDLQLYKPSEATQERFKQLRETWQTPDGLDIMEAPVFWNHARQLSCGFYYKWKNKPSDLWTAARKGWAGFVRSIISHNRKGYDTELQVAQAVSRGEYSSLEYDKWRAIRDTFKPEIETVWFDTKLLMLIKKWAEHNEGIIWTEHVGMGERLADFCGLSYYGQQGKNHKGEMIEDAHGTVIASIPSNAEGRNLQRWNKNLIVSCPSSAATFEQLVGRTHRMGQQADEVTVEILIKCFEDVEGFDNCRNQARYVENTTQHEQKILLADINDLDRLELEKLTKSKNPVWKK